MPVIHAPKGPDLCVIDGSRDPEIPADTSHCPISSVSGPNLSKFMWHMRWESLVSGQTARGEMIKSQCVNKLIIDLDSNVNRDYRSSMESIMSNRNMHKDGMWCDVRGMISRLRWDHCVPCLGGTDISTTAGIYDHRDESRQQEVARSNNRTQRADWENRQTPDRLANFNGRPLQAVKLLTVLLAIKLVDYLSFPLVLDKLCAWDFLYGDPENGSGANRAALGTGGPRWR